jgi:hypothetical protein
MIKIPCMNCICFPVCKSQAMMEKSGGGMYIRVGVLHKKCKLFVKWYNEAFLKWYILYDPTHPAREIKKCFFNNSSVSQPE